MVIGGVASAKQLLEVRGTLYTWTFGETVFQVDAGLGARITCFSLAGQNILTGPDVNPLNYGATFWTSWQTSWVRARLNPMRWRCWSRTTGPAMSGN